MVKITKGEFKLSKISNSRQYPLRDNEEILGILLKDRTTKKNIKWATDNYEEFGFDLNSEQK